MEKEFRLAPTFRRRINYERDCGQTIVLVTGCFDLLHRGHLRVLREWGKPGYFLIAAVNSDAGITRLKGPGRPVIKEADRIEMLAALRSVDVVFAFDDDTPEAVIRAVCPDIYVRGEEYRGKELPEQAALDEVGARVEFRTTAEGISTTAIIRRCMDAHYAGLERKHFGDLFGSPGDGFFGQAISRHPETDSLETIHEQFEAAKADIEENRP